MTDRRLGRKLSKMRIYLKLMLGTHEAPAGGRDQSILCDCRTKADKLAQLDHIPLASMLTGYILATLISLALGCFLYGGYLALVVVPSMDAVSPDTTCKTCSLVRLCPQIDVVDNQLIVPAPQTTFRRRSYSPYLTSRRNRDDAARLAAEMFLAACLLLVVSIVFTVPYVLYYIVTLP